MVAIHYLFRSRDPADWRCQFSVKTINVNLIRFAKSSPRTAEGYKLALIHLINAL